MFDRAASSALKLRQGCQMKANKFNQKLYSRSNIPRMLFVLACLTSS